MYVPVLAQWQPLATYYAIAAIHQLIDSNGFSPEWQKIAFAIAAIQPAAQAITLMSLLFSPNGRMALPLIAIHFL